MSFDAKAARALSQRTHSVLECLALIKRCVVQAADAGEYEATVGLSTSIPVAPGTSTNDAAFLANCFADHGHSAWADAVTQAARAGYALRPAWGRDARGPLLEGITLAWHQAQRDPDAGTTALMNAADARALSDAEQRHHRWLQARSVAIQAAARRGQLSVSLDDPAPPNDDAWPKRRELLRRAGFETDLIAADGGGATLLVTW
jgi:hypothetical protein